MLGHQFIRLSYNYDQLSVDCPGYHCPIFYHNFELRWWIRQCLNCLITISAQKSNIRSSNFAAYQMQRSLGQLRETIVL